MCKLTATSDNIKISGYKGTWYVIDVWPKESEHPVFLLESELYGEDALCLIVDEDKQILMSDVSMGFEEYKQLLAINKRRMNFKNSLEQEIAQFLK